MLKQVLNNYFGFNKQQRNGLFVLLILSLILFLIRLVYPVFIEPDDIALLNLPLLEQKMDSSYAPNTSYSKTKKKSPQKKAVLFAFDPNSVSEEQLMQLGLSEKTAGIFLKFRKKGFVFKQKEDLKKVYGISNELYNQLLPYVIIPSVSQKEINSQQKELKVIETSAEIMPAAKIELNTADSTQLVSLKGIGAVYTKRILKYRTLLGGFVAVEQLKEVYGFTDELYEKIKNQVFVNASHVKKLNLNTDDFKTINKHPYIGYETTKIIFDWRRKTSIGALNVKDILNDNSLYQRLLPYLTFE